MEVLLLVYIALGYWSTGKTVYANQVLIGTWAAIVGRKIAIGFLFGWVLIPIAVVRVIIRR